MSFDSISYSALYDWMKRVRSHISLCAGIPKNSMAFDENESCCFGETVYKNNIAVSFSVGVGELLAYPDEMVSMDAAMIPVVGLFHEVYGHGGQILKQFQQTDDLSKVIALNYYACRGSGYYYEGSDGKQYWKQPYEIAAQYVGIKKAHEYFCGQYGKPDADKLICGYVNLRVGMDSEFVHPKKPYSDVESILRDFNREFQKQVHAHRQYDAAGCRRYQDSLAECMRICGNDGFAAKVENMRDGLHQDAVLAAAYIDREDYNNRIISKPVFTDVVLDINELMELFSYPVRPKPRRRDLDLGNLCDLDKQDEFSL